MTVIWLMKSWPSVALLEFRYVIQMSGRIEIRISVWLTKITISNKNKSNCQYFQKHEGGIDWKYLLQDCCCHISNSLSFSYAFMDCFGITSLVNTSTVVAKWKKQPTDSTTSTGSCIDIFFVHLSTAEQFYKSKRSPWGTRTRKPNDWEADTRINNGACLAESCHILFGILKQKFDCQKPISISETNIPSYEWFKRRKKRCQECQGRPMWMLSDGPPSRPDSSTVSNRWFEPRMAGIMRRQGMSNAFNSWSYFCLDSLSS